MESKSQFIENKQKSHEEIYQQQIEEIFEKISELNESNTSFENHSKEWNLLFAQFIEITQEIAENLWKHTAIIIADSDAGNRLSKYSLIADNFEPVEYVKVARWILNGYDSKKAKSEEHSFWNYYITSLRNEVYRNYSRERAKFYYSKGQGISQKIQRGINLIVRIKKENNMYPNSEEEFIKKYDKENFREKNNENNERVKEIFVQQVQQRIDEYKAKGKRFWMPKECKNASDFYEYLVKVNEDLSTNIQIDLYKDSVGKKDDSEDSIDGFDGIVDEKAYVPGKVPEDFCALREKLESLQPGFSKFINRKKQNEAAQRKKIRFYSELLTLSFLQDISKTHPELSENEYFSLFENLNFSSTKIIKEFIESPELNLKKLSLDWNRPKNYASKQLKILIKQLNS